MWIVQCDPFLMKKLLKIEICGPVNIARCVLIGWEEGEKSNFVATVHAQCMNSSHKSLKRVQKKKKKGKTPDAKRWFSPNPNIALVSPLYNLAPKKKKNCLRVFYLASSLKAATIKWNGWYIKGRNIYQIGYFPTRNTITHYTFFFFLRKHNTLHLDKKNQVPLWGLTAEQRKLCYASSRSARRDVQNPMLIAPAFGVPNIWHLAHQTPKDFSHHMF